MGDRALIQLTDGKDVSPVLYLHWGGDDAVRIIKDTEDRMRSRESPCRRRVGRRCGMSAAADKIYESWMQDYDSRELYEAVFGEIRAWMPGIDDRTTKMLTTTAIDLLADDSDSTFAEEIRSRLSERARHEIEGAMMP